MGFGDLIQVLFTIALIVLSVIDKTLRAALFEESQRTDGFLFGYGYFSFRFIEVWAVFFITSNNLKFWEWDFYLFCSYVVALLCTGYVSLIAATPCCRIKIIAILAAGVTTGIFLFLLVICLFAKIGDTIWRIISYLAVAALMIFWLTVLILYGTGFLTGWHVKLNASLGLSLFIVFLLFDLHKVLDIGWFQHKPPTRDMHNFLALALHRDVFYIFIAIIFLIGYDSNSTNPAEMAYVNESFVIA